MKSLRDEYGTAMIMITHDLGVVGEICDDVAVMYAGRIVETGGLRQIFSEPKHPYTNGLFKCIPDIEEDSSVIRPIEGLMPEPLDLPGGCPFHPRCPHCMDICRTVIPSICEIDGHSVMCHLYAGGRTDDRAG
ncbi:MAG: ABC transporter ATP-binding protein, partial [Synergistaceae bacterium]|nr:ABC transporter ATP-binding protein [Synergistaceae bacterium]